jgi:hypothetical protein
MLHNSKEYEPTCAGEHTNILNYKAPLQLDMFTPKVQNLSTFLYHVASSTNTYKLCISIV